MVFGVTPYLINQGSIWEYSQFTRGISILIGIVLFFTVFIYFYFAVINSIMVKGVTRYIRIVEIVSMIFILQYVIPDETVFHMDSRLIILLVAGLSIIILDFSIYLIHSKDKKDMTMCEPDINTILAYQEMTCKKDGEFLLNLCIGIILFLFMADKEIGHISSYILLIAINAFLLYKYVTLTKTNRKSIRTMSLITLFLCILSIVSLEFFITFFSINEVLYIIMMLIPTFYLYPKIIKNYYITSWKSIME
jgi:hypothetical protein